MVSQNAWLESGLDELSFKHVIDTVVMCWSIEFCFLTVLHVDQVCNFFKQEDQGIIHGNIRCRKLLVAAHDDKTFLVRLADPGLHSYTSSE